MKANPKNTPCAYEGCTRTDLWARDWCRPHYMELHRNRLIPVKRHVNRKPGVTVSAIHMRLKYLYGKASDQFCVCGCGERAKDWAFDGTTGFSEDLTRYKPMARKCHARMDAAARRARKAAA